MPGTRTRRPSPSSAASPHGAVEATLDGLRTLREEPGGAAHRPIPPRFLRHADEQTVVGLAAVLRAMEDPALQNRDYSDWGVLAAPQFPGRIVGLTAFDKFDREGAAAVSPHIIPQHSLHSVSGAISIALALHGSSFGVGGGADGLAEGITAALTFLDRDTMPGLWLVLTAWDPEPVPDRPDWATAEPICRGVALALVPYAGEERLLRLTSGSPCRLAGDRADLPPVLTLAGLVARLATGADRQPWSLSLDWGGRIEPAHQPGTTKEGGLNMTQVWITGIGAVTPLGNDLPTFAANLLAGRSGVSAKHLFRDAPLRSNSRRWWAKSRCPRHGMRQSSVA